MERITPKISDYGLIGNCRTAALVSRFGSIDWCCFPRFDSESFFGAILDQDHGGHFTIQPIEPFRSHQRYVTDTNVLETSFETSSGTATLTDCFTVRGDKGELVPQHEILRIVRAIRGEIRLKISLLPRSQYGKKAVCIRRLGDWAIECAQGSKVLLLQSDRPATLFRLSNNGALAEMTISAGEQVSVSLLYSDTAPTPLVQMGRFAPQREQHTVEYWRTWINRCIYQGTYFEQVRRSALTLKLLTFAPSGAIIAAPTTSLPEWLGADRNWDYRFCWLRDASFTVKCLADIGYFDEAHAYLEWLLHATRLSHPKLQVVYSVYGDSSLKESTLPHLGGYGGSNPVRIGNDAWGQTQLDVYGELLQAAHFLLPHFGRIDRETRRFLLGLGRTIQNIWRQPDDGIWEVRSMRAHHTHSKVLAWVGLESLRKLSKMNSWKSSETFSETQANIRSAIETYGFSGLKRHYTRTFHGDQLDASLLVLPSVGYCTPNSGRFLSTLRAIQTTLGTNGLIYRYPPGSDGIDAREGAFVICSFWLAQALAEAGKLNEARKAIDNALMRTNGTGLLSEEIDPTNGSYLGNYPQAFSHIGLINAAIALKKSEDARSAA